MGFSGPLVDPRDLHFIGWCDLSVPKWILAFDFNFRRNSYYVAGMSIVDVIRSQVYGFFFRNSNPVSTQHGYYTILDTLPENCTVLDVGCGDGIYFTNPKSIEVIKRKKLQIKCIDPDAGAVKICSKRIAEAGLEDQVVATPNLLEEITEKYDYVLFMESFPVIDRALFMDMLKHAVSICKKQALLYHNLVEEKTTFVKWIKPIIGALTLVDFGVLTSVEEQKKLLEGYNYDMKVLLSCTYRRAFLGEMLDDILNPILYWMPSTVLSRDCQQYLISINAL
jgi:2-polyprenyl-3-methyl-5-hydroxy-6-metoxy-1,4-benzoquinol methylase